MAGRRKDPSQWASINDFRPGVRSVLSGQYPPGSANIEGTWGCYADDSGALTPLPLQYRFDIVLDPAAIDPALPGSLDSESIRIVGLCAVGPVFDPADTTTGVDQNNTDLFVMLEWSADGDTNLALYRYGRHRLVAPDWEQLWTASITETYSATRRPRTFSLALGRSNNAAPTLTGQTVLTFVGSGYARYFPDEDDPGNTTTRALPGDESDAVNTPTQVVFPDLSVLHQGRVIIMPFVSLEFGMDSTFAHNEAMYWTAYNDFRTLDPAASLNGTVTVGPENPVGYTYAVALSANELLLIKRSGGALLISGDVSGIGPNSPTARTLPYVKSAGLSYSRGTITPIGFAYPVDGGGVWLWQGGDFSQHTSKNLHGDFWRPPQNPGTLYGFHDTQFATGNNLVLSPNNYLLDTDHGSWWRTDDTDTFIAHRWTVDFRGRKAYATPAGFDSVSSPVLREYDLTRPTAYYSWTSQPIANTIESRVDIREVVLVASGTGTVEITATTGEDTTGQTVAFDIASDTPIAVRSPLSARGSHLVFNIVSKSPDWDSTDPTPELPAPTVYELRYSIMGPNPITTET